MEEEDEKEGTQKYAIAFIAVFMLGILILLSKLVGLI